jgi:site-specific DNA recombinase
VHNLTLMRCAAYARYSTDLQREESIEDQLRNVRAFANKHSWDILPAHVYADYGISGSSTDRPALKAMIAAALSKPAPFDVLLVDDTSRLSRNMAEAMHLKQQLEFAGIRLIAVSQGVDSADEQADVIWTVHGLVDSLFLKELAKKTHRGMEGLALRGLHTGGRCYGYRSVPIAGGGAKLTIYEPEAVIVRRIFEMTADGCSLKTIAKTLNAERIRSPQPGTKKKYDSWAPSGIREMIRRELYTGKIVWNKSRKVKVPGTNKRVRRPRPENEWKIVSAPELRIVSDDLWARVKARIKWTNEHFSRNTQKGLVGCAASSPYLLSGFLKCGECGANLVVVTGRQRKNAKYGCAQNFARGACSNSIRVRQDMLETMLFAELQSTVFRSDVVDVIMAEFLDALKAASLAGDTSKQHFQGRIKELENELHNLVTAIAKGKQASSALLESIHERETELRQLKMMADKPVHRDDLAEMSERGLRDFARARLVQICELIKLDVVKAKIELGKHVSKIIMKPDRDQAGYVVEGEWDLLGDYARELLPIPVGCREDVKVVPGGGVEPPRGVNLGGF